MKIHKLVLPGVLLFFLVCCSREPLDIQELGPQKRDGVLIFSMNNTSQDERLFGAWAAPQISRERRFVRDILEKNSGLNFDLIKAESVFIEAEMSEMPVRFVIKVNETSFPVSQQRLRLLVPVEAVHSGQNSLFFSFSPEEKVVLHSLKIFPKRFMEFQKIFDPKTDFLTPCHLDFFLNPKDRSELHLTFLFRDKKAIRAVLTIESEKKHKRREFLIKAKKEISIKPLDSSFHHIGIDIPETKSGFMSLGQSQVISKRPKTFQDARLKALSKNKNVLIIILDAARADHFSCYNYARQTTPNIDELAKTSFVFRNAISEAAYTLATTGTLLTGLPPEFNGVISAFYSRLEKSLITLPELFAKKGYFTAAITSNPYFAKSYDFDRGFAQFVELFQDKTLVLAEDFLAPFYEILKKRKNQPFFAYLHLREPHAPYSMPKPFFARYQSVFSEADSTFLQKSDALYAGQFKDSSDVQLLKDLYDENLAYADFVVGRILKILKEKNLFDQTITIITADHGEALGEHSLVGHNIVLHKEGIHIPLILHIPGAPFFKQSFDHPVISSDLIVTLCRLLELPYPYFQSTMGQDLFTPDEKRIRISRSVVMTNKYSGYMAESFPYKLIVFPSEKKTDIDLFNIHQDPEELHPLPDLSLPREGLRFLLNSFLKRASLDLKLGEKPELSKKELERLKSLGYIH